MGTGGEPSQEDLYFCNFFVCQLIQSRREKLLRLPWEILLVLALDFGYYYNLSGLESRGSGLVAVRERKASRG